MKTIEVPHAFQHGLTMLSRADPLFVEVVGLGCRDESETSLSQSEGVVGIFVVEEIRLIPFRRFDGGEEAGATDIAVTRPEGSGEGQTSREVQIVEACVAPLARIEVTLFGSDGHGGLAVLQRRPLQCLDELLGHLGIVVEPEDEGGAEMAPDEA